MKAGPANDFLRRLSNDIAEKSAYNCPICPLRPNITFHMQCFDAHWSVIICSLISFCSSLLYSYLTVKKCFPYMTPQMDIYHSYFKQIYKLKTFIGKDGPGTCCTATLCKTTLFVWNTNFIQSITFWVWKHSVTWQQNVHPGAWVIKVCVGSSKNKQVQIITYS